jgi:amino acid transporter
MSNTNKSSSASPVHPRIGSGGKKLTLKPLVIATFFMVSGGAYGTEDIIHGAGYGRAVLILLLTPLLWSLPTAFMVGELSSALPQEGGFYAWVRRAMGDFWGFQEAWLSLIASIFDMAIYPTLFIAYLSQLFPGLNVHHHGAMLGLAMIAVCGALNIAGVRTVATTSVWLFILLTAPFAAIVVLSPFKYAALAHAIMQPASIHIGLIAGLLIAMWNYMGWDQASTIAVEVEQPQRTYPKAMFLAVLLVTLSYVLPVAAVSLTHLNPAAWETGSWAEVAELVGGPLLRLALVLGGVVMAFGMFNALVMSYSRLPLAMAQDGMLPAVFGKLHPRSQAPWVAILVLSAGWALCLGLGFERLVTLDILLYGASLVLEFLALIVLRVTAPELPRPFRVPGGLFGAVLVGMLPTSLLLLSAVDGAHERVFGTNGLVLGAVLIIAGFLAYALDVSLRPKHSRRGAVETPP